MSMIIRGDYEGDLPSIVKILNEWRFYPNYHYYGDKCKGDCPLDPVGFPLEFLIEAESIKVLGRAETAFPFLTWMNFSDGTRVTTRAATVEQLEREDWEEQIIDLSLDEIRLKIAPHLRSGELELLAVGTLRDNAWVERLIIRSDHTVEKRRQSFGPEGEEITSDSDPAFHIPEWERRAAIE